MSMSTFFGLLLESKSRVLKVHFFMSGGSSSLNKSLVEKVQPSLGTSGVVMLLPPRQRRRPRSAVACARSSRAVSLIFGCVATLRQRNG